ncbi:hypothetical protein SK854_45805 [Lentzea sp. BCCO 10_0061]|uniref:Uncharacterized protein n=1 Tax=Lentzea sokolovensis TaxID=3095429 RepID=A0ABU4VEU1_9PSEU|nr:hypothetical protein [Lentzea sp. BCCO 10_0061]MDX8149506.1 hypothetical protein [Lentzea sp. BCCO 10_0061]
MTKSEHSYSGHEVGCGYSTNGLCGPQGSGVSEQDRQLEQQQYEWASGTGDGSNQPIIHGHRLPTAEEMKRGPIFGAPVMMKEGESYATAVKHWATYLCRSSDPSAGFCKWSETVGNKPVDGWDTVFGVEGSRQHVEGSRQSGQSGRPRLPRGRWRLFGRLCGTRDGIGIDAQPSHEKQGKLGHRRRDPGQADMMREAWVGPNYRLGGPDGKVMISKDELRQYRPLSYKPNRPVQFGGPGYQANFE